MSSQWKVLIKKIYNKDIAFALGNYISPLGMQTLLNMLNNNYYGARFIAAENLKKYPSLSLITYTDNAIPEYFMNERSLIAFLQSLTALNSNDFKIVYNFLSVSPVYNNEAVIYNLIGLLKYKIDNSGDQGIDVWYQEQLNDLQSKVPLKVR